MKMVMILSWWKYNIVYVLQIKSKVIMEHCKVKVVKMQLKNNYAVGMIKSWVKIKQDMIYRDCN